MGNNRIPAIIHVAYFVPVKTTEHRNTKYITAGCDLFQTVPDIDYCMPSYFFVN